MSNQQNIPLQARMAEVLLAHITTATHNGSMSCIADLIAPLPVIMLDEPLHTNEHPFCTNATCPCHLDSDFYREYIDEPRRAGLLTSDEANRIFEGRHI